MIPDPVQQLIDRYQSHLGENDVSFLSRVYDHDPADYQARLAGWGFRDRRCVLDAGCGFGQWTLGLARLNRQVVAVDSQPERTLFVTDLASSFGCENVSVQRARLDRFPFDDGSFDGIFCYGVLFLTRWRESLAELARVLESGGLLYTNANGLGWYRHMWTTRPNPTEDYEPREHVARVFDNTWRYARGLPIDEGYGMIVEKEDLVRALEGFGFHSIRVAGEARLAEAVGGRGAPEPFFRESYHGDVGVYEVLAIRK